MSKETTVELSEKPAADVQVPVVAYLRADSHGNPIWADDCVCQDPIYPNDPEGSDASDISMPMVRQADVQVALVAKDAEIIKAEQENAALRLQVHNDATRIKSLQAMNQGLEAEISALKAERDALKVAAKYAEHIDATPENQLQTMLFDTMTERDALRRIGGQLANIAFNVSQNPDRVLSVAVCSTLDKIRKEWDAAIAKE